MPCNTAGMIGASGEGPLLEASRALGTSSIWGKG